MVSNLLKYLNLKKELKKLCANLQNKDNLVDFFVKSIEIIYKFSKNLQEFHTSLFNDFSEFFKDFSIFF